MQRGPEVTELSESRNLEEEDYGCRRDKAWKGWQGMQKAVHTQLVDSGPLCEWWEGMKAITVSKTVMETDFLFGKRSL